jgi:hypothetical protein
MMSLRQMRPDQGLTQTQAEHTGFDQTPLDSDRQPEYRNDNGFMRWKSLSLVLLLLYERGSFSTCHAATSQYSQ